NKFKKKIRDWFFHDDELTIDTGYDGKDEDKIKSIKFIRKCWHWHDRKPRCCVMDNDKSHSGEKDNIIKIRIYADAIVRAIDTKKKTKRFVLDQGGKLEI